MGVQTDGPNVLVSVKQVLNEKDDADVAMVRPLREQVGDGAVGLVHEIVDHQQRWLPAVKVVQVRQVASAIGRR